MEVTSAAPVLGHYIFDNVSEVGEQYSDASILQQKLESNPVQFNGGQKFESRGQSGG